MTVTVRAALALASVFALFACASPRPAPPRPDAEGGPRSAGFAGGLIATPIGLVMTDFDADKDRSTTRAELDSGMDALWAFVDVDGNGELSAFEFADWLRAGMGSDTAIPGRVAFDSNANGLVSRAEFVAGLGVEFSRLDANSDDVIERAELVRLAQSGRMGRGETYLRREAIEDQNGQEPGEIPADAPNEASEE